MEYLDSADFKIKDKKGLEFLLNILNKFKFNLPGNLLFNLIFKNKWKNRLNQIEIIEFLLYNNNHDIFPFRNFCKKIKKIQGLISTSSQTNTNNHLIESFYCLDIVKGMLNIATGDFYLKVKELFSWAIDNIPEVLVYIISELEIREDEFCALDILQLALPLNCNSSSSIVLFEELEKKNISFLTNLLSYMYKSSICNNKTLVNKINTKETSTSLLLTIMEMCHKTKVLNKLVYSSVDYHFIFPLALLSYKKDYLRLEQWLLDQASKSGEVFFNYVLKYIKDNILLEYKSLSSSKDNSLSKYLLDPFNMTDSVEVSSENIIKSKENILESAYFNLESLSLVFSFLSSDKSKNIPNKIVKEVSNVYKQIFEIFDKLHVYSSNSDEVENQINSLFCAYFKGDKNVVDLINILKSYKSSSSTFETEMFALFVYSVMDEYRFLRQYPESELKAISVLYGQLIANRLFDGIIETIAFKYIIECLESGVSNLVFFSTTVIEQFIDMIHIFPKLIESLNKLGIKGNKTIDKVNEKYTEIFVKGLPGTTNSIVAPVVANSTTNTTSIINSNQPVVTNTTPPSQIVNNNIVSNIQNSINNNKFTPFNSNTNQTQKQQSFPTNTSYSFDQSYFPENYNKINQPNQSFEDEVKNFNSRASDTNETLLKNEERKQSINNNLNSLNASRPKLQKSNVTENQVNKASEVLNETCTNISVPTEVIDKTRAIFLSLSKNNILEKAAELKQLILTDKKLTKWFSNYFIVQRAVQNNYHQVYNELITSIDSKELNNFLIKDTIINIKKLLNSDKLEEKNILKSLGSWLGIMTLAKNKPILFKDLDLKELLFKAYESGKLTVILNLICKILESASKTKVFHAINPWLLTLLYILAEIFSKQQKSYNIIIYDVESLFKKLELDINQFIAKTKYLDQYIVKDEKLTSQNNIAIEIELTELYPLLTTYESFIEEMFKIMHSINPLLISKSELLSIIAISLQQAINEIISSVADRAINISFSTAKEIVRKDFAFEKDEKKFKTALVNCIKSLTGSLAMVTW